MASPQIENGHVKIATELWDALIRYRLPGEQRQIVDAIIRKTYGFNKKEDAIALSQFVKMTGIKKPNVVRSIKALLSKKIISVIKNDNKPAHVYRINKNYSSWKPLSKKITLSKVITGVIKSDNPSLSKVIPTKDNTTKDTIQKTTPLTPPKKRKPKKFKPPTIEEVADYFCEKGHPIELANTFYDYYACGNPPWHDRDGRAVRSWKQKAISVWFKNDKGKSVADQKYESRRKNAAFLRQVREEKERAEKKHDISNDLRRIGQS